MDTLEAIFTRRSVRQFIDKHVDDNIVNQLLKAAMSAPSAVGKKPWHFIVIKDKNLLAQIPTVHPYAQASASANLVIIPCADPELGHKNFWPLDLAAASQNILLAARALGLGGVWCGIYPNEERAKAIRSLLKIPKNIIPFCVIPLGYSDIVQKEKESVMPDRIHYNNWLGLTRKDEMQGKSERKEGVYK
ncbi:MAG: nitroreductase family protein [Gammaproteobacteria bacterium]|jgi:nitroreductase